MSNGSPNGHGTSVLAWFIALTSGLFTIVIIMQSVWQGRLSLPATYDDVSYFVDAAQRLQLLYDRGIIHWLAGFAYDPPHALFATLVPLVGFLIFGMHDWAPAAVNVVWVALLLYFVRLLMPRSPRWAYAAVALSTLAWPVTAVTVVECRPDMYAALLTVMGATLMLRSPFLQAPPRHAALIGGLFGVAILAKPTIAPITILLYGVSLATVLFIERRPLNREFVRNAARQILLAIAIAAAISLVYFIFAWRDIYDYIYTNTMGSQKETGRITSASSIPPSSTCGEMAAT